MPTYEYECETCGYKFEKFQNMKDEPVNICPGCGNQVKRLLGTGAGVILKGSGFHAHDHPQPSASMQTRCGKGTTCCGSAVPCDKPPCGD